jgi:hypothetical protein
MRERYECLSCGAQFMTDEDARFILCPFCETDACEPVDEDYGGWDE